MMTQQKAGLEVQNSDGIGRLCIRQIESLTRLLLHDVCYETFDDGFAEIESLVAALPLSSEHYGQARNRLRNADCYVRSGERCAARFELKLLARSLS